MKQKLTSLFLIFALLLTMAGCSAANAVQKLDAAEDMVDARLDALEDKVEMAVRSTTAPAPATAPAQPAPTEAAPAASSHNVDGNDRLK